MTDPKQYAKALFSLSEESTSSDRLLAEVDCVLSVLKDAPEYKKLLDNPAIAKEERLALVDEAFGRLDENLLSLIKIVVSKREAGSLSNILAGYKELYDESRGIVRAEIISAVELNDEQKTKAKQKIEKITGKTIILTNTVDPNMLGGVVLRYSGVQLDGSVRTRLDGLKKRLKGSVL